MTQLIQMFQMTHHSPPHPIDVRSPKLTIHTVPLKLTRAQIRRRLCAKPVSRLESRLMQKAIKELQQENALLRYLLCIR